MIDCNLTENNNHKKDEVVDAEEVMKYCHTKFIINRKHKTDQYIDIKNIV